MPLLQIVLGVVGSMISAATLGAIALLLLIAWFEEPTR